MTNGKERKLHDFCYLCFFSRLAVSNVAVQICMIVLMLIIKLSMLRKNPNTFVIRREAFNVMLNILALIFFI